MRTCPLHPRQLGLQLAARILPCDHHKGQRDAERRIGHWNKKLETKLKNKIQHKISSKIYKCAPVLCIHVSFACNQQLAYCRATITGSVMQSGALVTRTKNQGQS
jgi:hypothetical protein